MRILNNGAAARARRSGGATTSRVRLTIQTVRDDGSIITPLFDAPRSWPC